MNIRTGAIEIRLNRVCALQIWHTRGDTNQIKPELAGLVCERKRMHANEQEIDDVMKGK